jgi:DnaK suppressor protein
MDADRARARLLAERAEVLGLLGETVSATEQNTESAGETGDIADSAQPITEEEMDDAVAVSLRDRLEAIGRALKRLDDGTYGRSIQSGAPIPEGRLEADPAAELTVEEAAAAGR